MQGHLRVQAPRRRRSHSRLSQRRSGQPPLPSPHPRQSLSPSNQPSRSNARTRPPDAQTRGNPVSVTALPVFPRANAVSFHPITMALPRHLRRCFPEPSHWHGSTVMNALSTGQICAVDSALLTEAIRDYGSAKEVARVVGCSEGTAARYRRGETMPDAVGLARLMRRSSRIAQAMLRLAGLDDLSMDLEEARLREELQRLQAKRAGFGDAGETETAPGTAARPAVGVRGRLARAADALSDHAMRKATAALDESKRLSGK